MTRTSLPRLFLPFCATAVLLASAPAMAQANGDPGASMAGKAAADQQLKDDKSKNGGDGTKGDDGAKSGANAMAKGTSGGTGSPALPKGGSNAPSGSGQKP